MQSTVHLVMTRPVPEGQPAPQVFLEDPENSECVFNLPLEKKTASIFSFQTPGNMLQRHEYIYLLFHSTEQA